MYPVSGHEEQMEEFKYLAFLSYTARHFKNVSKKTKKIIGWTLLGIVTIVSVLVLWKFVAANPTIAVQPAENNNWYFATLSEDMDAADRLKDAGYISPHTGQAIRSVDTALMKLQHILTGKWIGKLFHSRLPPKLQKMESVTSQSSVSSKGR